MENYFTVKQIGTICAGEEGFYLELLPAYKKALSGLEGYSHINILWWFDQCDNQTARSVLSE